MKSYKFKCGCIIDREKAKSLQDPKEFSKNHRIKCPEHHEPIIARFGVCLDCGRSFEFKPMGKEKERCDECIVKHKNDYDLKYHKQPPDHNIKTDLQPNPIITNAKRAPCLQGPCQLAETNKSNPICVKCKYSLAYSKSIKNMGIAPDIVKTQHIQERSHILSVSCH